MSDSAQRLFRLVDLLQGRGSTTTAVLARDLGVSERTVRRDLARLQELEVPVQVRQGRGGGVAIEPGALLAPLRFTDRELLTLHLGLQAIAPHDTALAPDAASAARRLEAVLTPRARARAHALAAAVAPAPRPHRPRPPTAAADGARVFEVAEAVHGHRRVRLRYTSPSSGATTRLVDPYGLVQLDHWYLAAHCHLRAGLRTFRLDRIRGIDVLAERFDPPQGFDAFAAVATSIALAPTAGSLTCRVVLEGADLETAAHAVRVTAVVLEPHDRGILLTTRGYPDELDQIALHLLRLPWPMCVLEPTELRSAFRRIAARAETLAER